MATTFDAIVLGVGGMGSAAAFELARRGRRVLGLEQFPPAHTRGSSHGHTRIIRQAYAEHPDYVPLAVRAYQRWYDLEQRTGRHLFTTCPCLTFGPPGSELVEGVKESSRRHSLPVDVLSAADIARRFPAYRVPPDWSATLEPTAGFLYVEDCVRAHIDAAVEAGAEIHGEEPAREWKAVAGGVEVTTDRGTYHAAKLVVTAGAWATKLLADIGVPLVVMRQVLCWFDVAEHLDQFRRDVFPIFIADTRPDAFYGLPAIDRFGLKVARHYGAPALASPDGVDWTPHPDDAPPVRAFLERHIPLAAGRLTKSQVCMYTLTPDKHFVIDRHPHHPNVAVACGFSGHGFKFASAVGEVLADLADDGRSRLPVGFLAAGRFG